MNAIIRAFGKKRVLLPVVHVQAAAQAQQCVQVAIESEADGVFLINHAVKAKALFAIANQILKSFPGFWIGVNALDLHPIDVFERMPAGIRGVWTDNALVVEEERARQLQAADVKAKREGWEGLYFGGLAMKYQPAVRNLANLVGLAEHYVDVLTTSGVETGTPPALEKMRVIKGTATECPIAIASGITFDNVHLYPETSAFLVSTSINRSFYELDPEKTKALAQKIHNL